ncbi:hypothetical protein NC652_019949 [Populus alba x Populus x berolinensis]|nr:hypothetical protein NC652_019949 [Populus alba x Populus x berolinensis]
MSRMSKGLPKCGPKPSVSELSNPIWKKLSPRTLDLLVAHVVLMKETSRNCWVIWQNGCCGLDVIEQC